MKRKILSIQHFSLSRTMLGALLMVLLLLSGFADAEEKPQKDVWKPGAELTLGAHSGYVEEIAGTALFSKPVFIQSATFYAEKKNTGYYVMAVNFSPSHQESRESDFYAGLYTELAGMKIDAGYSYYWWREDLAIDFQGVYTLFVFPALIWQTNPFFNAEYRFTEKKVVDLFPDVAHRRIKRKIEFADNNLSGFIYHGGLKRTFKITDRFNVATEISVGGNTGIYGLSAENVSFVREKIDLTVSLFEPLNMIFTVLTQQNLGKKEGVATDTEKLFVSATAVLSF